MRISKTYPAVRILFLLLVSFVYARGQTTIPITASTTPVCRDATATYTAPRTAGYTYVWTCTQQGNTGAMISTTNATAMPVNWVGSGTAFVTVEGYAGNILMEQGSLMVNVLARPAPYITLDTRVGCQNLELDTPTAGEGSTHPPVPPEDENTESCTKTCAYSQTVFTAHGALGSTYNWSVTGGTVAFFPEIPAR